MPRFLVGGQFGGEFLGIFPFGVLKLPDHLMRVAEDAPDDLHPRDLGRPRPRLGRPRFGRRLLLGFGLRLGLFFFFLLLGAFTALRVGLGRFAFFFLFVLLAFFFLFGLLGFVLRLAALGGLVVGAQRP